MLSPTQCRDPASTTARSTRAATVACGTAVGSLAFAVNRNDWKSYGMALQANHAVASQSVLSPWDREFSPIVDHSYGAIAQPLQEFASGFAVDVLVIYHQAAVRPARD